jgi:hypothetical protein
MHKPYRVSFFLLLLFFLQLDVIFAQKNTVSNSALDHELTIFVIPELSKIAWDNPSILFKTTFKCYLNAALRKHYYVIGHVIGRIQSPLLDSVVYVAMNGAVQSEKVEYVIKKKVGLGVLGSTIKGRIEPVDHIHDGLALYAKRGKVAYLKFKINQQAVERLVEFVNYYKQKNQTGYAPCEFYNGALYPRYENEGSGCSAFAVTLLDIANVIPYEAKDEWIRSVKIPMELIGGEFNNNKKVKFSSILKTKSWFNGDGKEGVDFVNYCVYDPGLMFNWINNKYLHNDTNYIPETENNMKGLVVDRSDVTFHDQVIQQRKDTTFFSRFYYKKLQKIAEKNLSESEN